MWSFVMLRVRRPTWIRMGFAVAEAERSRFFLGERLRECCGAFLTVPSFDFAAFDRRKSFRKSAWLLFFYSIITTSATTSVAIRCVSPFTAWRWRGTRTRRGWRTWWWWTWTRRWAWAGTVEFLVKNNNKNQTTFLITFSSKWFVGYCDLPSWTTGHWATAFIFFFRMNWWWWVRAYTIRPFCKYDNNEYRFI